MRKFTRTFQNILHSESFTFSCPFSLRVLTAILIFWKERELLGDRINISTLITTVWFRVHCILYISFCSQRGWYFCTAFWWLMSLQVLKGCTFTKANCHCKLSQGMLIQTSSCQNLSSWNLLSCLENILEEYSLWKMQVYCILVNGAWTEIWMTCCYVLHLVWAELFSKLHGCNLKICLVLIFLVLGGNVVQSEEKNECSENTNLKNSPHLTEYCFSTHRGFFMNFVNLETVCCH